MPRPKVTLGRTTARDIAKAIHVERPDLNPNDYVYLLHAQRCGQLIEAADDKHCRAKFGISSADMRVLYALRRSPPDYALRPTELFHSLLVTSGAITKQVDRLAAGGFVDRRPGPTKSGGVLIHLTEKGFETASAAWTSLANSSILPSDVLTDSERATLIRLLEKMLVDLEARPPE